LDQGFPDPLFDAGMLDRTVELVALRDFDLALTQKRTPDWYIYCAAIEAGFHGFVTRDHSQADQIAELFTLSRMRQFAVITQRKGIDDPVREWGQLLAYLPEVKKLMRAERPLIIFLPNPTLSEAKGIERPAARLSRYASENQLSTPEVRHEAVSQMRDWASLTGHDWNRLDALLNLDGRDG
jgi:hypothetical protein